MLNQKIVKILKEIAELLRIKGTAFKPRAFDNAANTLKNLDTDVSLIYEQKGLKGLEEIPGIGKSIASKIKECIETNKINYYEKLKKETAVRQIITHFFQSKEVSLEELKQDAKKQKIVYSRYTRPAKQLLELAGSIEKAKSAIDKVASWAKSRNLDYAIETVFKKWLELDRLKPKEVVKKPFYENKPMVWSETKRKWYVIDDNGDWLEFAGKKQDIKWRIIK